MTANTKGATDRKDLKNTKTDYKCSIVSPLVFQSWFRLFLTIHTILGRHTFFDAKLWFCYSLVITQAQWWIRTRNCQYKQNELDSHDQAPLWTKTKKKPAQYRFHASILSRLLYNSSFRGRTLHQYPLHLQGSLPKPKIGFLYFFSLFLFFNWFRVDTTKKLLDSRCRSELNLIPCMTGPLFSSFSVIQWVFCIGRNNVRFIKKSANHALLIMQRI